MRARWSRLSPDAALAWCAVAEAATALTAVVTFEHAGLGAPPDAAVWELLLSLWLLHRVRRGGRVARGVLVIEAGFWLGVFALTFASALHGVQAAFAVLYAAQLALLLHPAVRARVRAGGVSPHAPAVSSR